MRRAFVSRLADLAEDDHRIVLLTADLGFGVMEQFAERHPDRFYNVGVAEQNMIGMATGLAESGYLPFVYSIATFAVLRPYEFIRNGPALHQLPVRIVGTGAGVEYGHNGVTHFGLEDVAVLRALPELDIVAPADARQSAAALERTWDLPGPVYYRLGKREDVEVPGLEGRFSLSGVDLVAGPGVGGTLVLALGNAGLSAVEGRERAIAGDQSINCSVAVVSRIHAGSGVVLAELMRHFDRVVTVEAHGRNGGLGSLAAEVIAEQVPGVRLVRLAVDGLPTQTGSQAYMEAQLGIDSSAVDRQLRLIPQPV